MADCAKLCPDTPSKLGQRRRTAAIVFLLTFVIREIARIETPSTTMPKICARRAVVSRFILTIMLEGLRIVYRCTKTFSQIDRAAKPITISEQKWSFNSSFACSFHKSVGLTTSQTKWNVCIEMSATPPPGALQVQVDWSAAEDLPVMASNVFLVQQTGQEFFITFKRC